MISLIDFFVSWKTKNGLNKIEDVLSWVDEKNISLKVRIDKINLKDCKNRYLDNNGFIRNTNDSFFKVCGLNYCLNNSTFVQQPIILQDEIGYLGIIVKKINGILHFLMQAKIEPGNVNKIQISPTIQATKSNFEQKHGGKKPAYLDYFLNAEKYEIVVDQIQSEQSSRFLAKRNRNIIINIGDDDIDILPSHVWLTLGQIKELMKIDNLVNMDTRTVLSCIPFSYEQKNNDDIKKLFDNSLLINSILNDDNVELQKVFRLINNFKMFNDVHRDKISLLSLSEWNFADNEFVCKNNANFKLIFCSLQIEGREVKQWCQPLFEANGMALFVLFCKKFGNKLKFLVRLKSEVGTFDKVELGPTIQCESNELNAFYETKLGKVFKELYSKKSNVMNDVILSEEGGRFYHEQNKNVILNVDDFDEDLEESGFIWLDYKTLNHLIQYNNVLNIQLRNLLSLLEA